MTAQHASQTRVLLALTRSCLGLINLMKRLPATILRVSLNRHQRLILIRRTTDSPPSRQMVCRDLPQRVYLSCIQEVNRTQRIQKDILTIDRLLQWTGVALSSNILIMTQTIQHRNTARFHGRYPAQAGLMHCGQPCRGSLCRTQCQTEARRKVMVSRMYRLRSEAATHAQTVHTAASFSAMMSSAALHRPRFQTSVRVQGHCQATTTVATSRGLDLSVSSTTRTTRARATSKLGQRRPLNKLYMIGTKLIRSCWICAARRHRYSIRISTGCRPNQD